MPIFYKIISSVTEAHALTNKIYFNKDVKFTGKYICLENLTCKFTYVPEHSPDVPSGSIMLNAKQREIVGKKIGDVIDISFSNETLKHIKNINVDLDTVKKSVIDCELLTQSFKEFIVESPLSVGQSITQFDCGDGITVTCKILRIVDMDDKELYSGIFNDDTKISFSTSSKKITKLINMESNYLFKQNLNLTELGIGGLDNEFNTIFRRAFASRSMPKKIIDEMGIKHTKGILLYGPPGCGKTLLARRIGQILDCVGPKIVSGPSLLDKFVGGSEKNVRDLFNDAFADKGSGKLHLIICDEFDALCKQRGSTRDGTGVADNIVNQFLTMIDGPDQLDNVLLICMTNRKELIDEAILRAGRLELHIEINLPDQSGRYDILKIHTSKMQKSNHLAPDVNLDELSQLTKNYTGAELEGLVKCASQSAIYKKIDLTGSKVSVDPNVNPIVTMSDFVNASNEIVPMFGKMSDEINEITSTPFIIWNEDIKKLYDEILKRITSLKHGNMCNILITGKSYVGKTKLVAHVAKQTNISCIRIVTPEKMLKVSDKSLYITNVFSQCQKSESSILILDNIERIIEWSAMGSRFNNQILQTIMTLLRSQMKKKSRMIVICTSNKKEVLEDLELFDLFDNHYEHPTLISCDDIKTHFNEIYNDENIISPDGTTMREIADVLRLMKFF